MRFFRFRDRGTAPVPEQADAQPGEGADAGDERAAAPPEPGEELADGQSEDASEEEAAEYAGDVDLEDDESPWRRRAAAVIVGGASTGSKRPEALYGEGGEALPTHFVQASGCELTTAGGATLIDCTMALGSVALGYADPGVTARVVEAVAAGNVAALSHVYEVEVAERLCDVIPCAEQVRFLKTGAEAVAAAVRIARTATGRSRVVGSGYFGWLDWWSDAAGVPSGAHADYTPVGFDDVEALEREATAAGSDLAAIVVEPVVERLPSDAWIAAARALCDRLGAVLVFDEIKTGFRLRAGGYQAYAGVTPDLAAFGKAMANGFPLAAVVGKADVMEAAHRTWISSTLASEGAALAAALAVLERHEKEDVCEALWRAGGVMRSAVADAVGRSGVGGARVEGIDPMWLIRFDDAARQTRFIELAAREGVLFKRGAYNFAALAHDERAIVAVERAASTALVELLEEEAR
jgi:glutamate-1-semialdehyde 2,1-aminomutase